MSLVLDVLDPTVRRGFEAWTSRFEGFAHTMYLDVRGYPTTGAGDILLSAAAACALPWQHGDGSPADAGEIATEYALVHAMPAGRAWTFYAAGRDALRLDDDAISTLVLRRLDADVATLAAYWPAFASFPAPAQQALCSLAWAVGASAAGSGLTGPTWPHLHAAVAAQDWHEAARAGVLSTVGNPGVGPRNVATAALFEQAAGMVDTIEDAPATPRTGTLPPPAG